MKPKSGPHTTGLGPNSRFQVACSNLTSSSDRPIPSTERAYAVCLVAFRTSTSKTKRLSNSKVNSRRISGSRNTGRQLVRTEVGLRHPHHRRSPSLHLLVRILPRKNPRRLPTTCLKFPLLISRRTSTRNEHLQSNGLLARKGLYVNRMFWRRTPRCRKQQKAMN